MVMLGRGEFAYEYQVSGLNWGNLPKGRSLGHVLAVAVDSKDQIYICNVGVQGKTEVRPPEETEMLVLDTSGNLIATWEGGLVPGRHGMTIGPDDSVYCVCQYRARIDKFTPDGRLLMTISGEAPAFSGKPFNNPTDVAVDLRNGDLYVSDGYGNARVHKYTPDGRLLFSWGERGTGPGEFNTAHNIGTDRDGWVYVADRGNRRVQVFDSNGRFETQWVNMAPPAGLSVDTRGDTRVYVAEYWGGSGFDPTLGNLGPRISIFDNRGNVLAKLGDQSYGDEPGRFYSPHSVAVDSKGDIYVADGSWGDFGRFMDPPQVQKTFIKLEKQG